MASLRAHVGFGAFEICKTLLPYLIIGLLSNCDVCELFLMDDKQCQKHIYPNYIT